MKKLTSVMVVFTLLIGCGSADAKKKAKMPQGSLLEVTYSEWEMTRHPNVYYRISTDKSHRYWIENISQSGDTTRYEIDESCADDLRQEINDSRLYNLEPSYHPKEHILDGTSWHFFANFDSDDYISSGGSNAWPTDIALNGIADRLANIFNDAKANAKAIAEERAQREVKPIGRLTRLVYAKYGTTAGPLTYYELSYEITAKATKKKKKTQMGYVLRTINPKRFEHPSEPEYLVKRLTSAQALKITKFVADNKMYALNNNYPGPKGLLDGSTWKIEMEYSDGDSRSSGGSSMNGPLDRLDRLLDIFKSLIPDR